MSLAIPGSCVSTVPPTARLTDEQWRGTLAYNRDERIQLEAVVDAVGRRSFGALLLLAGLLTLAPLIGDIPGVPTIVAFFVLLIAVQLIVRRKHFWLPRWMLKRSVDPEKFHKTLEWCRRPARFVDKALRPRLTQLTEGVGAIVVAAVCLLIALVMPIMEVIPFSANGAGAALTAFGLALIANDGLLALIAFALILATLGLIGYHLIL